MSVFSFNKARARRLHTRAEALSEAGRDDEALEVYARALELDADRPTTLYNIGLIHKYRLAWEESRRFNADAYRLDPNDEAARWNLAIAATALRDWDTARRAWRDQGLELDGDTGPIRGNFGSTPVRLNPDGAGEVVWATRVDPVRASIDSVPLPESGFRHGDLVLHDGAAVGYRRYDSLEYPVFNVLELFEPSANSTYVAVLRVADAESLDAALDDARARVAAVEDWTDTVRSLCRQCSEGVPHEAHDADLEPQAEWQPHRRLGIAAAGGDAVDELAALWRRGGVMELLELELALRA